MYEENTAVMNLSPVITFYNIQMQDDEILPTDEFDPEAVGHLRPKLIQANKYIESLNKALTEKDEAYRTFRSQTFQTKNKLEDYLKENAEDMDIEHVKDIAEMFDIELKKTIEFTATIEVRGEIEVDLWTEEDNYFEDVDFQVDLEYGTDGSVSRIDVTSIEER